MIHAEAYNSRLNVTFFVTFVYASNSYTERQVLWNDLKEVAFGRMEAWIVLGDFNNVLYSYEWVGGELVHWRETEQFVECVAENGLIHLKQEVATLPGFKGVTMAIENDPRSTEHLSTWNG